MADVVEAGAARYRRRSGRTVTVGVLAEGVVAGRRRMIGRVVSKLVENAPTSSAADSALAITVDRDRVKVSDRRPA